MKTNLSRPDADSIAAILHRAGYNTGATLPDSWGPTVIGVGLQEFAADALAGRVSSTEPVAPTLIPLPASKPAAAGGVVRFVDLYHLNDFQGAHDPAPLAAQLVSAGVPGLIHKASDGLTGRDPLCMARLMAARAAGLCIGAYHFVQFGDGAAQADNFLAAVGVFAQDPTFLLAIDFEPSGKRNMTLAQGRAFIQRIIEKTGRAPVVYGGGGLLRDLLAGTFDAVFALCGLWLAEYAETAHPIPPTYPVFLFWQYKEDAAGNDWNLWQGALADFRAGWPFMHALPTAPALATPPGR